MHIVNRTRLPKSKDEFLKFSCNYRIMLEYRLFLKKCLYRLSGVLEIRNINRFMNKNLGKFYFDNPNSVTGGLEQVLRNSQWKYFPKEQVDFYSAARLEVIAKSVREHLN